MHKYMKHHPYVPIHAQTYRCKKDMGPSTPEAPNTTSHGIHDIYHFLGSEKKGALKFTIYEKKMRNTMGQHMATRDFPNGYDFEGLWLCEFGRVEKFNGGGIFVA